MAFTKKSSIADVEATENSYYVNSTTVYAHIKGDGTIPSNVKVILNSRSAITITCTAPRVIYFKYLDIVGLDANGYNKNTLIILDNCRFMYNKYSNGATITNATVLIKNCRAFGNQNDGISFSACDVITVNSYGYNNGDGTATTQNGITGHSGTRCIIVGGEYYGNNGPNVAFVHENTQLWCIDVYAHDSAITSAASLSYDFNTQESNATIS